jgi:hypothetical protein
METPESKDMGTGINGLALAAFVLGISSVSGLFGSTFFSSFAQDGALFAISLIPPIAGLACAIGVRQQMQVRSAPAHGAWFGVAGAILCAVGALTNILTYLRIQDLDSPFG